MTARCCGRTCRTSFTISFCRCARGASPTAISNGWVARPFSIRCAKRWHYPGALPRGPEGAAGARLMRRSPPYNRHALVLYLAWNATRGSAQTAAPNRVRYPRVLMTSRFRACLVLLCALAAGVRAVRVDTASLDTPSVLILNSYHPGHIWTDHELDAELEVLREAFPKIEPFVEYMDWKRHPTAENVANLERSLRYKYGQRTIDLVIVNDNGALDYVLSRRDSLFAGVPVVFAGINGYREIAGSLPGGFTGVAETIDPVATLELALRLHPRTREVVIVTEQTESGLATKRRIERVVDSLDSDAKFTFADRWEMPGILAYIRDLPPDALVYMTWYTWDPSGTYYDHLESVDLVVNASPVPVYHAYDFALGRGIVGGYLLSATVVGRAAGDMAARILRGTPPDSIAPLADAPCPPMFDYAQLQRFGIPLDALPAEASLANRAQGLYARYRTEIQLVGLALALLIFVNILLVANIARRRRAEAALRRSEEKYRMLSDLTTDAASHATIAQDGSLRDEWLIDGLSRVLGYDPDELGTIGSWERVVHPDDRAHFRKVLRTLKEGETTTAEVRVLTKSGDIRWVHGTVRCERNAGDGELRLLSALKDITERKRAETERERLREQLHHSRTLEAIGQLAGGVAHDLNNLLVPVLVNSEMLLAELGPDDAHRELVEVMKTAGERARDLVSRLLAIGQRQVPQPRQLEIARTVAAFSPILRSSLRGGITLRFECGQEPLTVKGDRGQLELMLLNLVINARDAIEGNGEIVVDCRKRTVRAEAGDVPDNLEPGAYAAITVRDSGQGMSPETLERIFEPFFTTKPAGEGTGLGLATVYAIARQHGGTITAESSPGDGARFTILLPLARDVPRSEPHPVRTPGERAGRAVMVVDDDETVRRLAVRVLRDAGYRVHDACGPQECIKRMREHGAEIAVLLTDVILGGTNGRELYEQLAADYPALEVVYMSGYPADVIGAEGIMEGEVSLVRKPFSVSALTEAVAKAMKSCRLRIDDR
ncbi:MAG: response regulator [Chitinivibrionales bacterium]|nr:response regulator [Chitinivibrionales bacterium]